MAYNSILHPFAAEFQNQPLMVSNDHLPQFESLVSALVGSEEFATLLEKATTTTTTASDDYWDCEEWEAKFKPYEVNADGILFVPVRGVLLHNFPYQFGNYATGYDYIMRACLRGLDDANVRGIALLCNSPGGMVAGCFETADRVYDRRDEKPIRAFAHESAYSAAYAWASVASAGIVVSRTGGVGSVGVVTSHVDLSKMYDEMGVKQTFIFAGKHKVDGNSAEPLPADVKERIQVRIDELYEVFVSSVARNRGMEEQAIRDTEALCFTATQAVSIGLADSVGPLDDAVAQFCVDLSTPNDGEETMSNLTDTAVVDQAVHEQAVTAARAEGFAEGNAAAQTRIGAILGSDEAKGREAQANHIAFKTNMSVEDAVGMLAASAKVEATADEPAGEQAVGGSAGEGGFDAAMNSSGNPDVGASGGSTDDGDALESILALAADAGILRKKA